MDSTAISIIDLHAIRHNYDLIHQKMPNQKILAMIKSNAYGHGLIHVAKSLPHANAFGVATIAEALQLISANVKNDIVVMRGFATREELSVFLDYPQLIACVHDRNQLQLLEKQHESDDTRKMRIWMKVDSGMHRLGFQQNEFAVVYQRLNQLNSIYPNFVICSHLADADNADPHFTQSQITLFHQMTHGLPNEKSVLNSAGILAFPEACDDWIRPGLLLYGVSPFDFTDTRNVLAKSFTPAMTFESKLISVKHIQPGDRVGYSCTYTATQPMTIGIVGMGYGDSYPRHAKNGTPVLIRGMRCPIVGRVSMDMITVDITHVKNAAVDDTVTLWGRDLSVNEIAHCVNTVSHELLCHLTGRVQRVYSP